MNTKIIIALLFILLTVSVYFNVKPRPNHLQVVAFHNANTRPNYDTYHKINEAQTFATGKGIKVGIIDKYFGFTENMNLYAGGKDFIDDKEGFENIGEHGLWMATTLKEIAPNVEIYALQARAKKDDQEREAIIKAIDWAIENHIDVLTYSGEAFRKEDREKIDLAVRRAIDHNIVTTFIHYDLSENILPYGFFPEVGEGYARKADVNIYHFDYNFLLLTQYESFVKLEKKQIILDRYPIFPFHPCHRFWPVSLP